MRSRDSRDYASVATARKNTLGPALESTITGAIALAHELGDHDAVHRLTVLKRDLLMRRHQREATEAQRPPLALLAVLN